MGKQSRQTEPIRQTHPELAREWHPLKNGQLTPENVTSGSGKRVWWRCAKDPTHEWEARVQHRANGIGCPICSGKKAIPATSLAALNPAIAAQWNAKRNGTLTPDQVRPGSGKKVWWRCSVDPTHEWQTTVDSRVHGSGCPMCAKQKAVPRDPSAVLAVLRPDLAKEWNVARNGTLTPAMFLPGSQKAVWWRCSIDPTHEWMAKICCRAKGQQKCPRCASLQLQYPQLANEWHPQLNGALTPDDIMPGSDKIVWWRCSVDPAHEWKARIANRVHGRGCPMCAGRVVTSRTSLRAVRPELAAEWHPEKNGSLTPENVTSGSNKIVWWRCATDPTHEWKAQISGRASGHGCPVCAGKMVIPTTSLKAIRPDLAAEWDENENARLKPDQVAPYSNKKVWWKCNRDPSHRWAATINARSQGSGCPMCAGQIATPATCLRTLRPDLTAEWLSDRNGALTPDNVRPGSNRKVWWRCAVDPSHEWRAQIGHRTAGAGCPMCSGRVATPETCLRAVRPDLAAEWHSYKNGTLTPDDVTPGSGCRVWWRCSVDPSHEWCVPVNNRSGGSGCPICSGRTASSTTSLQALYPDLAAEWHPDKNNGVTPDTVRPGAGKRIWWRCAVDNSHEWQATILSRSGGSGCPFCWGRVATPTTSLQSLYPKIAAEWHPQKNGDLSPEFVRPGSDKKVWWQCARNPLHEWQSTVLNRVKGSGCPICTLAPRSRDEIILACELEHFFDFDLGDHKLTGAGCWYDVDIIIQDIGLVIEFDGSYWHRNRYDADRQKSEQLTKLGWQVIRVREDPLPVTGPNDVTVPQREYKLMVDRVVLQIKKVCGVEPRHLGEYLDRTTLVNLDRAEAIISELLDRGACDVVT